jgi:hypothetical protein
MGESGLVFVAPDATGGEATGRRTAEGGKRRSQDEEDEEAGSRRQEAGRRKQEAGSRRREAEDWWRAQGRRAGKCLTDGGANAERRTPNAERRTPNAERRTQSAA